MNADLIIFSTQVFNTRIKDAAPAAIAIKGEKIIFVGPQEDAMSFVGPSTLLQNFDDAFIMPGFHDSHMHVFHSALYSSPLALSYLGKNEQDCVDALAPLAARRPKESWLLSQGWREYRWDPPSLPSKRSLDARYPNRPVAMYSGDAHTLWVNSTALNRLGITADSTAPEGGNYVRDEQGELTGIIRETAAMELMPQIMKSFSTKEITSAYLAFFNKLASQGISSVCDMALMPYPGLDFVRDDIYEQLALSQQLPLRVHLFPTLLNNFERFDNMRERFTGPMLRASGLKQFFDGVSSQHSAFLAKPYTNARFPGERGQLSISFETMRKLIINAAEKGYSARIHTIGDEAIHLALDIFEEAIGRFGAPSYGQNCLEHLENLQPKDIPRLANLGILAAVQPPHITLDPGGPERDLGPERTPYMWPFKSFLKEGVALAFGTDSPVVSSNPFDVLYAAVTRQDPHTHQPRGGWLAQERIGMPEAISAYTIGSAQAAGRSQELGSLEVGKYADIVVLDRNLLTIDADMIQKTQVIATYVGGTCIFRNF